MRFEIETEASKNNVIKFSTYIDDDGDFSISANGVILGYISAADGHFHRYHVAKSNQHIGLSWSPVSSSNNHGYISVV